MQKTIYKSAVVFPLSICSLFTKLQDNKLCFLLQDYFVRKGWGG
jgi:hypothetical protein